MITMTTRQPTAKQAKYDEERKAAVAQAHETLKAGIADLGVSPDAWKRLLDSRRWLKYSLNNQMLIMLQCPEASDVRPYGAKTNPSPNSWKAVSRFAKPGQHALRIFAPLFRTDEATGERIVYGFKLVPVFDISQTDGDALPAVTRLVPELLTGDAPAELQARAEKHVAALGYSFSFEIDASHASANGVTHFDTRKVTVRPDRDAAQQAKTTIHEIAHIELDHGGRDISTDQAEVEAESVAYIVCSIAGLDSLPYSVPYVAGWAGGDESKIEAAAKLVLKVADKIVKELGLEVAT